MVLLKKKLLLFVLILLVFSHVNVLAAETEPECADVLHTLGLFQGVGTTAGGTPDYDLDGLPTRAQAVTMLVRLLGKEDAARAGTWETPFTDVPEWAAPYVGYAYSEGLTQGTGDTAFSANANVTEQQYVAFLLRALGYSESAGDFTYSNALSFGHEKGLTAHTGVPGSFTRGTLAADSYRALCAKQKGTDQTLSNKLLWDDVFTTKQLDNTHDGTLFLAADMPDLMSGQVRAKDLNEVEQLIRLAMKNNLTNITISLPGCSFAELNSVPAGIVSEYDYKSLLAPSGEGWDGLITTNINTSDFLMLEYYYANPARYEKNYQFYREDLRSYDTPDIHSMYDWVQKVNEIVAANTTPQMDEAAKVRKLHDYLCKNTVYDMSYEGNAMMTPHYAANLIFEGHGVCDGYAEAFKILCNGAGIECSVIYGESDGIGHAWNQVKINGQWYNMDVTWDDTVYADDRISYDYFCKSDSVFYPGHTPHHAHSPNYSIEVCPNSL